MAAARAWRPSSPKRGCCAERYGVDTLEVADEYPTRDRARWEHILDRLIEEDLGVELLVETRADDMVRDGDIIGKYRDAGILHMYVGVESRAAGPARRDAQGPARRRLRARIELLNEAGIITETSFLLGFPDDTPETVEETLRLAFEYAPDLAFFLAITPWPYADLYPEVADRVEVIDYSKYNLINPIIRPDAMTRDELAGLLRPAFMRFYGGKMRNDRAPAPHTSATYMVRVAQAAHGGFVSGGRSESRDARRGPRRRADGVPGRRRCRHAHRPSSRPPAPAGPPESRPRGPGMPFTLSFTVWGLVAFVALFFAVGAVVAVKAVWMRTETASARAKASEAFVASAV